MGMKITLLDYSETFYRDIAGKPLPDKRTGKFVQIRKGSREYLVFAPRDFLQYHANIVEKFCLDKELNGTFEDSGKRFVIFEPGWIVSGGGKFEIDAAEKRLRLYDNSMAYGKFDARGLREKILSSKRMKDYKIVIE